MGELTDCALQIIVEVAVGELQQNTTCRQGTLNEDSLLLQSAVRIYLDLPTPASPINKILNT
jgi:hypothetical protein